MKKITNTLSILAASTAGFFLAGQTTNAATWVGGGADNEFSTIANWDDGLAPASGSTQDINSAVIVERSVDSTAGRTFVSGGGSLNITGGNHSDSRSGNTIRNFLGRGSAGTINQSDGSYNIGHMLSIGGGGASGNGIYNLSGGSLNISRGGNSIIGGSYGNPSLEVSDEENAGSGLFDISGGDLITRFGVGIGSSGTFRVSGSGSSSINIGNNSNGNGWWEQETGSTLDAIVDSSGITKIFIDELAGSTAVADFATGSLLNLSFDGAAVAGTWTILELENQDITDNGLALASSAAAGWSFNIDNSGTNGLLTASYAVPEPSSTALLGLSGFALILRRRK